MLTGLTYGTRATGVSYIRRVRVEDQFKVNVEKKVR